MARLSSTIRVNASPDRTWAVVGDLDGVHRWIPGVTVCRIEGAKRICNEGEIQEEISDYSDERRSYRYTHVRVPLPVKTSRGMFSVVPDNSGSLIVMESEIEALDPGQEGALIRMIDGYYKQALESLRQLIEASGPREAAR